MASIRQLPKFQTGIAEVDRALAVLVDTLNPVLRGLAQLGTHPTTPAGAAQTGTLYMGAGAPANGQGNPGDFYFRTDTPGTANQRLYVRTSVWTGIL